MSLRKYVQAIFSYSKVVAQFLSNAQAFKEALTTAPGNTYVTIAPATITTFTGDIAALTAAEATAQSGEDGTAAARDLAWQVVIKDVRALVRTVQAAADDAPDEATAIAIVLGCGLTVRNHTPRVAPDIEVRNDKVVSGLIHLVSKAAGAGLKASYEWQWSTNGATFTPALIAMKSRATWTTTVAPGTKLYFRKRVITNKDAGVPAWSQTVNIIVN